MADRRDRVYDREQFDVRIGQFAKQCGVGTAFLPGVAQSLGYVPVSIAAPSGDLPGNETSIGYELRHRQREFFASVLPLDREQGRAARLVVGHGPPGSGKTLVGIEVAIEALGDNHTVDILVPSWPLAEQYRRVLRSSGVDPIDAHSDGPGVRVMLFDEWFAWRAGIEIEPSREAQLREWVRQVLEKPALRARFNTLGGASRAKERLPALADALLHDDEWWASYDEWARRLKDRMVTAAKPVLDVLNGMRSGLLDQLDTGGNSEIRTRSELAKSASMAGASLHYARLTLVDEAQDMAPAEWRTLLPSLLRDSDADRRLVMLGDMRQRVSFVPFTWEDIKDYAVASCSLAPEAVMQLEVDSESYRMGRNIARSALAGFASEVIGPDASRRHGQLDLERLRSGGKVFVAVVARGTTALESELRRQAVAGGLDARQHVFCIRGPGAGDGLTGLTGLINYSVRDAKGLEAEGVIVNQPFGTADDRRAGTLDYDDATEFYTAISRARDAVLLIVDEPRWKLLARAPTAWNHAEVRVGNEVTIEWLRRAIEAVRVRLSADEIREKRMAQLESLCHSPDLASKERVERIEEALAGLGVVGGDLAWELVNHGANLATLQRATFEELRSRFRRSEAKLDASTKVTYALFFGEVAMALRQRKSTGVRVDMASPELLLDYCSVQNWRQGQDGLDAGLWTDEVAAQQLTYEVAARFRKGSTHDLRREDTLSSAVRKASRHRKGDYRSAADELAAEHGLRLLVRAREVLARVRHESLAIAATELRQARAAAEARLQKSLRRQ